MRERCPLYPRKPTFCPQPSTFNVTSGPEARDFGPSSEFDPAQGRVANAEQYFFECGFSSSSGGPRRWTKMHRPFVPFSVPESSAHTRSLADFITTTYGFRFSVHTPRKYICREISIKQTQH